MSTKLGMETLHNLDAASQIEWMENNKLDIYSSSTALGMNTRREHGLFVVPDPTLQKHVVLLSKFEESIFIDNKLNEISTNEYQSGVFPAGYQYLESFEKKPFPCSTFNVQGHILQKTIFLLKDLPILIVRYELKNKAMPINLIIKPFLAERYSDELAHEMRGLNTDSYVGHHFVRWALKHELPELYIYFNRGEYVSANLWYKNFIYKHDRARYGTQLENLFNPGFFQVTLEPYQYLDLYVSSQELDVKHLNYESLYRREKEHRTTPSKFYFKKHPQLSILSASLKDALSIQKNNSFVSVSHLENLYTTRDMLFSLPGMFLINDDYNDFKNIFKTITKQVVNGLLPVHSPLKRSNSHFCAADLSLWLINIGFEYFQLTKDIEFFNDEILESFRSICEHFEKGTSYNIYMDRDGLIFAGDKNTSVSWIPLKGEEKDTVMRYGKMIEINALWYSALMVMNQLYVQLGKKRAAAKFARQANKTAKSFMEMFYADGCVDFSNTDGRNTDFRINQIVPLSLPFTPLGKELAQSRLKKIDKELLTPYGLKVAIFNTDKNMQNMPHRKSSMFYTKSIWPWSVGMYISAALKWNDNPALKAKNIKKYFQPLLGLVDEGLLGYLPEAVVNTQDPDFAGIPDYTPSASCVIWGYYLVQQALIAQ